MGRVALGPGPKRTGVLLLLLIMLGAIGALALAQHLHVGTEATAVAVVLSLPPAYLAWGAFRADRIDTTTVALGTVAGQLAVGVRSQWDDGAAVWGVNHPHPLPVAWRTADHDLAGAWPLLMDLARNRPGGPPGDPALWPPTTAGLAGQDAEVGGGLGFGVLAGLAAGFGIVPVPVLGLAETSCVYSELSRAYLAVRRKAPWDALAFLQDAHESRAVPRQVGATYQFPTHRPSMPPRSTPSKGI